MSNLNVVSVPRGYALTITAPASSGGSYYSVGNPGDVAGSISLLAAGASVVIGPFDGVTNYALQGNAVDLAYSLASDIIGDVPSLSGYAPLASPTFTGAPILPVGFKIGATVNTTTGAELNFVHGVTSNLQTQLGGCALVGSTVTAPIAVDANGTLIATAVNGIITALIAAGILHIS